MRRLVKHVLVVLASLATVGVLAAAIFYVFLRLEHNKHLEPATTHRPFRRWPHELRVA